MGKNKGFKPTAIMSIHGISSNGSWQDTLDKATKELGYKHLPFKYGRKLTPLFIDNLVKKFKDWYLSQVSNSKNKLSIEEPYYRPSIVAHSLGTWIVVRAMNKYPEIKFDKIFLHGSIVPVNFDWYSLILNDKVDRVILMKSSKDLIVRLSFIITKNRHPSCISGFLQKSTLIKTLELNEFRHSDFQYKDRLKRDLREFCSLSPVQLKLCDGENFDQRKIGKLFNKSAKLDRQIYGEEYINSRPLSQDTALQWALVEKNIWSFLIDSHNDELIGYINIVSVSDEVMDGFTSGNVGDSDIDPSQIVPFGQGGKMNLIIMSVLLDPFTLENYGGFQNSKAGEYLIIGLSQKILRITDNGRNLGKIASVAWSKVGDNLCQSFLMQRNSNFYLNNMDHPIYQLSADDISKMSGISRSTICNYYVDVLRKNIVKITG